MKRIIWLIIMIFAFNICFADVLIFKDGKEIKAEIQQIKYGMVTVKQDGKLISFSQNDIDEIIISRELNSVTNSPSGITETMIKEAPYNSYLEMRGINENTETMKTLMAWEFGIAIAVSVVAIGVSVANSRR